MKITLVYLVTVSVFSIIITVFDKLSAHRGGRRISEQALLCTAALGGSFAMLITMILVRHKTKKIKFTAGIPLIIAIQFLFTFFVAVYVWKMR